MARFLVDADLPRSLAHSLHAAGLQAEDVRDLGLRKSSDDDIFSYALAHDLTVISGDSDFGNLLRFPLGSHPGIIIARFPNEISTLALNEAILRAIQGVPEEDISGNLIVIEPGRIRLRKP